jgi:hypothetical protein
MNEDTLQRLFHAVERVIDADQEMPEIGKDICRLGLHVGLDLLRDIGSIAKSLEKISQ